MDLQEAGPQSARHRAAVQAGLDALLSGASLSDAAAAADAVAAGERDHDETPA